jgi:PKD repeat protein
LAIMVNATPQAVATASVTSGTAPLAVAFNALGSADADGDALTYAWDLDGDSLLDDSTAAQPAFTYTTPGTYTVTLKITDTDGASSTAAVGIAVQAPDPAPGPGPRTSPFVPIGKPGSYVQGTTLSGLIQGVSVSQSAETGQPARAIITTASAKADGSRPGATFEIAVHLPPGMGRNTSSFETCHPTSLETQGPPGCPAGSVIGAGSAVFDAWPAVVDFVDAQVTIFNGPGGSVLLYVLPDLGPAFVIEGQPMGGSAIEFAVPPIHTVPGAPLGALAELTLDLQSSGYLTNPPDCPTAGFTWGFDFLYESGERLSSSLRVRCTGASPVPVTTVPKLTLSSPPAHATVARDTTKPVALAAGPSRQDIDKLFVRASMSETGRVTATGSISIPGSAASHRFKAVTRTVAANRAVKLSPKLSSKSLKAVKRALKRRKTVKALITLTAKDQAGNATVRKRTIRLRP